MNWKEKNNRKYNLSNMHGIFREIINKRLNYRVASKVERKEVSGKGRGWW